MQPSKSLWAIYSPVVLVRKRDGSLWFFVDYPALNSVDVFSLPQTDNLLDKLGHAKYFTTLLDTGRSKYTLQVSYVPLQYNISF